MVHGELCGSYVQVDGETEESGPRRAHGLSTDRGRCWGGHTPAGRAEESLAPPREPLHRLARTRYRKPIC